MDAVLTHFPPHMFPFVIEAQFLSTTVVYICLQTAVYCVPLYIFHNHD